MKKLVPMALMIGIIGKVAYGSEQRKPTVFSSTRESYPNISENKPNIYFEQQSSSKGPAAFGNWRRPLTYAKQRIKKGEPIPKGYVKSWSYNEGTPEEEIEVEKKIASGRNEYYNQFIEGYEPKENFEWRMEANAPLGPKNKNVALHWLTRMSPRYKKEAEQEELQLQKIEEERAEMPSLSKRHQQTTPTPLFSPAEPSALTKFSNWFSSWWSGNTNTTNAKLVLPQTKQQRQMPNAPTYYQIPSRIPDSTRE